MRIDDAEEGLGDLGELVIDFEVDAGGEEGEGLDHALDVGILAFVRFEAEARGDLGIFFGELRAHLAEECQLAFVVEEEVVAHGQSPFN